MEGTGDDRGEGQIARDEHRRRLADGRPVAELADVVETPAVRLSRSRYAAGVRLRGREGGEGVAAGDREWRESIDKEAVAELTRAAESPAECGASFVDGAGMRIAGADEDDAFFHGRVDGQCRASTHRPDGRRDD